MGITLRWYRIEMLLGGGCLASLRWTKEVLSLYSNEDDLQVHHLAFRGTVRDENAGLPLYVYLHSPACHVYASRGAGHYGHD